MSTLMLMHNNQLLDIVASVDASSRINSSTSGRNRKSNQSCVQKSHSDRRKLHLGALGLNSSYDLDIQYIAIDRFGYADLLSKTTFVRMKST